MRKCPRSDLGILSHHPESFAREISPPLYAPHGRPHSGRGTWSEVGGQRSERQRSERQRSEVGASEVGGRSVSHRGCVCPRNATSRVAEWQSGRLGVAQIGRPLTFRTRPPHSFPLDHSATLPLHHSATRPLSRSSILPVSGTRLAPLRFRRLKMSPISKNS